MSTAPKGASRELANVLRELAASSASSPGLVTRFQSLYGELSQAERAELFDTLWEAQVLIEQWRREYNALRPHSSLGYRPPAPESWSPDYELLRALRPATTLAALGL